MEISTPIKINKRIDVFIARLSKFKKKIPVFLPLLSEDEISKVSSYKFEKDKFTYILRRGLLRKILSTYIGRPPNELLFDYNQNGKPYLNNKELYFNISYSENNFSVAISPCCEIGIDIAVYQEINDIKGIIKLVCNKYEINALKNEINNNIVDLFLRYWTGKEAYLKNIGAGLSIDPRRIQIDFQSRFYKSNKLMFDGIETEGYSLRSWEISTKPKLFISIFADEKASIRFIKLS